LECQGCLQQIEPADAKWVRPFDSPTSETDDAGDIVETHSGVYSEPVPGAEPYCQSCLDRMMRNAPEA